MWWEDSGEIEERARGRRPRDAAFDRDLVGRQGDAAGIDPADPDLARRDHLDRGARGWSHAPERRRRAAGEDRFRATRQHACHPPCLAPHGTMADGIDAVAQRLQPPERDAVFDCTDPEPEGEQLRPRHHAVLPTRERRDRLVDSTRGRSGLYLSPDRPLDRQAPIVAACASRITTHRTNSAQERHRRRRPPALGAAVRTRTRDSSGPARNARTPYRDRTRCAMSGSARPSGVRSSRWNRADPAARRFGGR